MHTYPPTARFPGSSKARQEVGKPGHCEKCAEFGHVAAHPELGCGDVGCTSAHPSGMTEPVNPLAMPEPLDLDAIEARTAAATPGPWAWRGNTDNDVDVYLSARLPGAGVVEVLGTIPIEREVTDFEVDRCADGLGWSAAQARHYLTEVWAHDPVTGGTREDRRLCVYRADPGFLTPIRELAVYQVARAQGLPDDTPATDPRVYRRDVCDVRHPDAQFIAHAREDIPALIAEVKRLRRALAAS